MSITEKLFKIISNKHSFMSLAGVLESLQILLEGQNILPTDEESNQINEADCVLAAQVVLLEKVNILLRHKGQTKLILKLQNDLEAIILFAGKLASERSKKLWNQASAVMLSDLSGLGHGSYKTHELTTSHKHKVLNFINKAQSKNIAPKKMKDLLVRDAKEIQKIKSSYNKYHDASKDSLTEKSELLTLPSKFVTKSVAKNTALYKG